MAAALGRGRHLPRRGRPQPAQILRARDVPLSVGAHPHGPCPQLHPGRRRRPAEARPGLQRAASDGLGRLRPARRGSGDQARRASAHLDLCQHRRDARADQGDGPVDRLVARAGDLRSGVLPARAEDVHRALEEGARLSQGELGQLGSGRPDRAGQRAGDRRPRLALGSAGRAAQAGAVVLQDHRLRRRSGRCAGPPGGLAREGPADAAQLDRPLARRQGAVRHRGRQRQPRDLHHPPRHAVRRQLHGGGSRPSAELGAGRRQSGAGGLRRRLPARRHQCRRGRDRREAGLRHRAALPPPVPRRRHPAGLRRQLRADGLWHRRHLRLPGARPARPRLRPQIWPAGAAGGAARRGRPGGLRGRRRSLSGRRPAVQLGLPRRARRRGGQGPGHRRAGAPGHRQRRDHLPAARLGRVAAALLGLPGADAAPGGRHAGAGAGRPAAGDAARRRRFRPAGQSPRPASDLEARHPARRPQGRARDRHLRHLRRKLLVLRPLLLGRL